ncbi:phasin family protein [bacterium]|nr:phasin family protein [bacterium]
MSDIIEKSLYIGLGILTITKEKAEQVINELVDKGKIKREESSKAIKDLIAKAEEEKKILSHKIETGIENALTKLNIATKKDLETINKKLDKIIKQQQKRD